MEVPATPFGRRFVRRLARSDLPSLYHRYRMAGRRAAQSELPDLSESRPTECTISTTSSPGWITDAGSSPCAVCSGTTTREPPICWVLPIGTVRFGLRTAARARPSPRIVRPVSRPRHPRQVIDDDLRSGARGPPWRPDRGPAPLEVRAARADASRCPRCSSVYDPDEPDGVWCDDVERHSADRPPLRIGLFVIALVQVVFVVPWLLGGACFPTRTSRWRI